MIAAVCKDAVLQKQIYDAKSKAQTDQFDIWWLGQSGFLIQWSGVCVLFDPYLSDSLTKKYADTKKPHVRMSERVIAPEMLDMIDIVTSSHNHTDHLDAETLIPLIQVNPQITLIIPEANRHFVADRVKCSVDFPVGLNDSEKYTLKGLTFHGVPAAHNTIERDDRGRCRFMGFVVQFGKWSIYHSGDTLWYDKIVEVLKPFRPDVAFLPINGNDLSRGVAGNLNAHEAVALGEAAHIGLVIPHHYHMFEFNTADPQDFASIAEQKGQHHKTMEHGEHFIFRSA